MLIRRLTPLDAAIFQTLRLSALRAAPSAFGSSYGEEKDNPASAIEARLAVRPDQGVFGAFEDEVLVGVVGLGREKKNTLAHKAFIWGMYVDSPERGKGIGRALLLEAVSLAKSAPGIQRVNLCVTFGNTGAIRLYEAIGFKAFGREPDALLINGEFHDEIHMSLRLRDDVFP